MQSLQRALKKNTYSGSSSEFPSLENEILDTAKNRKERKDSRKNTWNLNSYATRRMEESTYNIPGILEFFIHLSMLVLTYLPFIILTHSMSRTWQILLI